MSIGLSLSDLYNVNPAKTTGNPNVADPTPIPINAGGKATATTAPAMSWLGLVLGLVLLRVLWEIAE